MNYKSMGAKIGLAAFVSLSAMTFGATNVYATDIAPQNTILVATDDATKETLVTTDYLNVRTESNTDSTILGVLNIGTTVEGIRQGEWFKIRYNGQNGYVNTNWLKAPTQEAVTEELEVVTRYTTDNLNVRAGAGTSFNILGVLPRGTKTEGSYVGDGWFRIQYDGRTGFVHTDYLHWTTNEAEAPAPSIGQETRYTTAYLNVRKGPGTSYDILGVLNPNKELSGVYEGHWFKIQYAGQTAYVSGTYLSAGESKEVESTPEVSKEVVTRYTTANLNVRAGSNTQSSIRGVLSTGTEVSGSYTNNGWFQIEYNGETAFVSENYLTEKKVEEAVVEETAAAVSSSTMEAIIADAKAQVGKRYVYGTAGPNTFDCSGLTYYLYSKHAGVTLPRSSASQASAGTTVSKSDMQPGDLIFFINPGATRIGHVAIYVGGGQYVHASTPATGVRIDSTSGSYFNNSAVLIKRIVD